MTYDNTSTNAITLQGTVNIWTHETEHAMWALTVQRTTMACYTIIPACCHRDHKFWTKKHWTDSLTNWGIVSLNEKLYSSH